jgi:hypothetical protein
MVARSSGKMVAALAVPIKAVLAASARRRVRIISPLKMDRVEKSARPLVGRGHDGGVTIA